MSVLPVATRPLSRSVGAFPLVRTPGPWLRSYRSYATGSSQTRPISTQRRAFDKRIAFGAVLLLSGYLFSSVVHLDSDATLDGPRPNRSTKVVAHNGKECREYAIPLPANPVHVVHESNCIL